MFSLIRNWIPPTKSFSPIVPAAHHSAFFLIQSGTCCLGGWEIPFRYGEYYLNKKQRREKEEQEKRDWYKSYCMNIGGKFVPYEKLIPNQEFYDKVLEAIKEDSPTSRKEKISSLD